MMCFKKLIFYIFYNFPYNLAVFKLETNNQSQSTFLERRKYKLTLFLPWHQAERRLLLSEFYFLDEAPRSHVPIR